MSAPWEPTRLRGVPMTVGKLFITLTKRSLLAIRSACEGSALIRAIAADFMSAHPATPQRGDLVVVCFMADAPLSSLSRHQLAIASTRGGETMNLPAHGTCQSHCSSTCVATHRWSYTRSVIWLRRSHAVAVDTVAAPPMNLTWFPVLLADFARKPRMRYIVVNMNIIMEVSYGSQW